MCDMVGNLNAHNRAACVAEARERIQSERARAWAEFRRAMDQLDRAERALLRPLAERDVVWRVYRRGERKGETK